MKVINERLVYTGDILERDGQRYDVAIADDDVFVICKRSTRAGKETGSTSYRSPEVYSNQTSCNTLDALRFAIVGSWLGADTPSGRAVAKQRAADKATPVSRAAVPAAEEAREEPADE